MTLQEKLRSIYDVRGNSSRRRGKRSHTVPDSIRNILTVLLGEFCGTFMFLLLSFIGAQTAIATNDPNDPNAPLLPFSLLYIAASFGTALAVNVWIFYRVTGGMFNPAVSPIALRDFPSRHDYRLTRSTGHRGTDARWRSQASSRHLDHTNSARRGYCCSCRHARPHPWATTCYKRTLRQRQYCQRPLLRDVPDISAGPHGILPRC